MSDIEDIEELEEEVKPENARFICNECDTLFKNAYDVKKHYKMYHWQIDTMPKLKQLQYPRIVLNEINYNCEYCEKKFTNNELLEKHLIKCLSKVNLIKDNEELKRQINKLELCNNEYKEIITKLLNIQK